VLRRGSADPIEGELLDLGTPSQIAQAIGMPAVSSTDDPVLCMKGRNGLITLLPMAEVQEWKFLDQEILERDPEQTGQHLTISLEGSKAGQKVTLTYYYLWRGVQWTPSYLLERRDDGRVQVELRGEIVNKLIDMAGTRLFLVVGVPNFLFLDQPSPMAVQKSLQQVTSALQVHGAIRPNIVANTRFTQMVSNVMTSPSAVPIETRQPERGGTVGAGAQLPDVQSTDAGNLHLYEVEAVDLAKGERAIIHLANMNLACSDLVTWDITDKTLETATHSVTPADRAGNPLLHYWRIQAGETPLTTGPALVMRGDLALSQDRIFYTPRQSTGQFKVGNAIGVSGTASEVVIARKPGRMEVNDRQAHSGTTVFWLKKEIRWIDETRLLTIKVRNGQKFATDLQVTRQFRGRPERLAGVAFRTLGGMTETEDEINQLSWEVSLKPGEKDRVTITYVARIFTQR
jgi:hypothetical protein